MANGEITPKEYMDKLEGFIRRRTSSVTGVDYRQHLLHNFGVVRQFYKAGKQADGQTGKQTEKQAGKQTGGQTGKQSQGKAKKQSSKQKQGQP